MAGLRVVVRLFGAFRRYASGGSVSFEVPPGAVVSDVRDRLVEALGGAGRSTELRELVAASVIADDERILDEAQELGRAGGAVSPGSVSLAVLPPVCGG